MKPIFDVTTTHNAVTLDDKGAGTVVYTVTNSGSQPQRAMFRLHALDGAQAGWASLVGEAERDMAPGKVEQVEVRVQLPAGTPAPKFRLRLDALSAARPEEVFTEGPPVSVTAAAPVVPVDDKKGGMPWWVWLLIALVLLVVAGLVGYLVMRKKPTAPPPPPPPASAPASNPPPPPPVVTRDFDNPQVQVAGGRMVWLDLCREWANNCGKPAADAFCARQGLGVSHDFKITPDAPPTGVIGTGQLCAEPGCDRISWVRCGPRRVGVYQLNPETLIRLKEAQLRGKQIVLPE